MNLDAIHASLIDSRTKGIPAHTPPFRLDAIGEKGWNVLAEDMNLPLAVLKQSGIAHNSAWMRDFIARSGAVIAPHGKTTMAPQLFQMQLDDGAWAITIANPHQMQVARAHGVNRIIMANQVIGTQGVHYVLTELRDCPELDFYCIVDSEAALGQLECGLAAIDPGRPLQLFLEGGMLGGRTGVRDIETGLRVARRIKANPRLALRGVEGFEGLVSGPREAREAQVRGFLDLLVGLAKACEAEDLFAPGEVILTAGGSAYYDMVLARFRHAGLSRPTKIITRSGCYLSHDAISYRRFFSEITDRTPDTPAGGLVSALEVWGYVQSRPEPDPGLCPLGARDISGGDPPLPQTWYRPGGGMNAPVALPAGHHATGMNDQHCYVVVPVDSPLAVGDMVSFGVSHPCLTFDKWQVIPVVDDAYNIVGAVRTFF